MNVGLSLGISTPSRRGIFTLQRTGRPAKVAGQRLPLPLFVAGVGANDVDPALAAHDLAVFTDLPHARTHFHDSTQSSVKATQYKAFGLPAARGRVVGF